MDFLLTLTHFCDLHGPKSVLCTQVLPIECGLCLPPSPPLRPRRSSEYLPPGTPNSNEEFESQSPPTLRKTDTDLTLPTQFSGASTAVESEPSSPHVEKHPLYRPDVKSDGNPHFKYGRAQGDTCASCTFSVPQAVASKLPQGAPGSPCADGKTTNGAPVLRSREFVCLGSAESNKSWKSYSEHSSSEESKSSSCVSAGTPHTSGDCHDHTLTYLTSKSPDDPESFTTLQASIVRTLSCELLPRGMSDGRFWFGDENTGYTIAYVFRLTDPKARGKRRAYAFLALAGNDASRAFRACPMLWETFATMAKAIETAAQKHHDEQRRKEEHDLCSVKTQNYTPISSFLTQRPVDQDGNPRRAGQTTPRSLAEIVGDENIFTFIHTYFVALLKCLGDRFGGLPLADKPAVYQTTIDQERYPRRKSSASTINERHSVADNTITRLKTLNEEESRTPTPSIRDDSGATSFPITRTPDDIDLAKSLAAKTLKLNPQCKPVTVNATAQRQVVV